MDLISDLETDLAFAFLVEKRHKQEIDAAGALALIGRVKTLLESIAADSPAPAKVKEPDQSAAAH
jgi:hypothetical protein